LSNLVDVVEVEDIDYEWRYADFLCQVMFHHLIHCLTFGGCIIDAPTSTQLEGNPKRSKQILLIPT
jgi:hypothetical protein